jgi:hypothetical protein
MVDGEAGDGDSVAMDNLPKCVMVPLTEEDLHQVYESSVGFPWEIES